MRTLLLRLKALLLGVPVAICPTCRGRFLVLPGSVWDWKCDEPVCKECEDNAIRRNSFLFAQSKEG